MKITLLVFIYSCMAVCYIQHSNLIIMSFPIDVYCMCN